MALSWDSTLVMGVPELDEEHEQLFAHVDALLQAIRRGSSRDEVARTLAFLAHYARTHFAAEEALMRATSFSGYAEHKAQHDAFSRDLALLQEEHRRDGASPSLILRVNGRVTAWLRDHIYQVDRVLADHLHGAGR